MISAAIREDDDDDERSSSDDVHSAWIKMVRDLAHNIEDCLDRFMHRVTLESDASWFRRKLHRVKTVNARNKFAKTIRRLRKTSEEASVLRERYKTEAIPNKLRKNHTCSSNGGSNEEDEETETVAAVGMEAARDELMEMIRETSWTQGHQPDKLKVISLVGFGGIGKTLLARQAYDDTGEGQYEAQAWVRAADKGARDVLKEILKQLGIMDFTIAESSSKLRATLKDCLGTKRFFIVIDDMRTAVFWHDIKDAFPVVSGVCSRVLVTTAIQSVANACSAAHGHLYMMTTLDGKHSRQLFFKEASMEDPGDSTQPATSEALTKCDGLPLALVTTAQFLQSRGKPERWANLCENLGKHLEAEDTLARMKRVLTQSYTSLGSQDVRACLLYLGIYPSGHPIRRGSLIRRWLAEGIIKEDHKRSALSVAVDSFDELVNRSIIQPTDASSAEVKKCQPHGMMLEFILHKSMCEDFVTLLYDKDPLPRSNVRRLSLHNRTAARVKLNPKDLCLVRSLTVFGKAHKSVLDFSKYKQLRVLDLEECNEHLDDKHLKHICNLLLLRYLSLGGAVMVTMLPKEIKKLKLLETLDVRRTNIEIMPTQVMELPCLIHLFGKFKLQRNVGSRRMRKLQTWLSEKSKLETLAGFVFESESQGFTHIMEHMKHLTKAKIWCESTTDVSSNSSHLSKSIKGFIQRGTHLDKALSLTLNINDEWSQDLLNFSLEMDCSYYLRSLKLQGNNICSQLPQFVTMLRGLTKMCLSFPGHNLSSDILAGLSRVHGLEYLKLIATQLDEFIIGHDKLGSLRHLCIMVEVITGLEFQEGALPRLESLQLLCEDLNGFSSTTIQSLPRLKEVGIHDGVSDETKKEWKGAAKNHPRCPKLLFVTKEMFNDQFKLLGSEPAAKISHGSTVTGTMAQEVVVESGLAEDIESPATPRTDTTLSVTTPPGAISTGESVPVATSETGSEPAAKIPMAPATTDNTILPVNHDVFASAQECPVQVVASEMGSVVAAKIHVAPATTDNTMLSVNHDALANAQQEYGPVANIESFMKKVEGVAS
ncbi:hypothetical protein ACQJBY_061865 [Aegilops geniculata]